MSTTLVSSAPLRRELAAFRSRQGTTWCHLAIVLSQPAKVIQAIFRLQPIEHEAAEAIWALLRRVSDSQGTAHREACGASSAA